TAWPVESILESGIGDEFLRDFDSQARQAFVELALAGLLEHERSNGGRVGAFPLYRHQVALLRRGVEPGRPGVITSGTGSGKTESFLLPIVATISKEAVSWPEPSPTFLKRRWWQGADGLPLSTVGATKQLPTEKKPARTPFRAQRDGENPKRKAAVRALILY